MPSPPAPGQRPVSAQPPRPRSGTDPHGDHSAVGVVHGPRCGVCRDPRSATHPVTITSGDLAISIPLCDSDAAGLMGSIDAWLAAASAAAATRSERAEGRRLQQGEAVAAIREWALAQGYPVARSGSLSQPVIAAYRRAHGEEEHDDVAETGAEGARQDR